MSVELLNVDTVQGLMRAMGLKSKWVIEQIGLTRTPGYDLLRDGKLPKDPRRKAEVIRKLGKLLRTDERQLIVRLEAKTA